MLKPAITLVAIVMAVPLAAQFKAPPPVSHRGERPVRPGPASNFTGKVTVEALVNPLAPGRAALGLVTFSPGARSHWHTHPAGQSLYVTDGCGWTQREGRKIERICKGDVAYVPAGVRHWHGGTDQTAMTHISVSESIDGRNVNWAEPVSNAEYLAGRSTRG